MLGPENDKQKTSEEGYYPLWHIGKGEGIYKTTYY
jgi:hypothetical protein